MEAQLAVGGHGIVHEHYVIGQFAIVQNFTMILTQLATFCFKPELILKGEKDRIVVILNILCDWFPGKKFLFMKQNTFYETKQYLVWPNKNRNVS